MREPETALPELDCVDDPRGGAVACALLIMGATLVTGVLMVIMWAVGAAW
ncbi:MAG: hypothetical protein M3228_09660 [Actinomycetota bacterium]|nr:hypothetical protein [Actinomycetota bacterium]